MCHTLYSSPQGAQSHAYIMGERELETKAGFSRSPAGQWERLDKRSGMIYIKNLISQIFLTPSLNSPFY